MTGARAREHRGHVPEPCLLRGQGGGEEPGGKEEGLVTRSGEERRGIPGEEVGRGDPQVPRQVLSLELAPASDPACLPS